MRLFPLITRRSRGILGLLGVLECARCLHGATAPVTALASAEIVPATLATLVAPRSLRSDSVTLIWSKVARPDGSATAPVAYEILREIRRKRNDLPGYTVLVNCHPAVADVLSTNEKAAVADAENRFMRKITVVPRKEYHYEQFDLVGK